MEDLATLGIAVDATSVDRANKSLDDLKVKSGQAEAGVDDLVNSTKQLGNAAGGASQDFHVLAKSAHELKMRVDPLYASQVKLDAELREAAMLFKSNAIAADDYAKISGTLQGKLNQIDIIHKKAAAGARLHNHEVLGLTRQFADLGVTAAMGMNPIMILIQQGPQIAEIFALAKARGLGFTAVMGEMIGLAGPLLPILAGLAAAAGVFAAGFAVATKKINDDNKNLVKTLGFTEAQLDRVKHKSVTMGDVVGATFEVLGDRIYKAFKDPIDGTVKFVKDAFAVIVGAADKSIGFVVGIYSAGFAMVGNLVVNQQRIFGDAVITVANKGIDAVEFLVNKTIEGYNKLVPLLNAAMVGMGKAPIFGELDPVSLGKLENPFSGAMKDLGAAGKKGFQDGIKGWADFKTDVAKESVENAVERMRKEAGKAAKGRKPGKTEEERERERAIKEAERFIETLKRETAELGLNAKQKQQLAIFTAGMKAPTKELREEIAKLGAEWLKKSDMQELLDGLKELEDNTKLLEDWTPFDQAIADADRFLDKMYEINDAAQSAAAGMSASFGHVGNALGGLLTTLTSFATTQAEINAHLAKVQKEDPGNYEYEKAKATAYLGRVQVKTYGDMASSAKHFFKEKSTGYKVVEAAEKAFRAVEFAMSVKSMAQDLIETARKLAGSASRAAGYGAEAIANALKSVPFPLNLAAAAATTAALVAAGVAVFGGGGGGSVPTAQDRQEAAGTGSVLGDPSAKSASIANALEIASQYQNKDLEYSNAMVRSLKAIEGGIGALAAAVARNLAIGGSLDTSNLGLGTSVKGPGLLTKLFSPIAAFLPGLFGTSKKVTLNDLGLDLGSQTVGDILSGGVSGNTYQELITQTKKKAFGITYSNKTRTDTVTGALDQDLAGSINDVILSLRDATLSAAKTLGIDGAQALLDSITLNFGKLSFKDMSSDEIQAQLEAVFSKAGDDMAAAVGGDLVKEFQKVGEGALETLIRLARGTEVFDVQMRVIGKTVDATGLDLVKYGQRLIDLSGGLEDFVDKTNAYAEAFLSEAERMLPVQKSVANEMQRLGYAGVDTKDEFKALVNSLDLTTDSGQALFAALMDVAPAFAKVADYANKAIEEMVSNAADKVKGARDDLQEAYNRESQALKTIVDRLKSFGGQLKNLLKELTIGDAAMLSPRDRYNATKSLYEQTYTKALGGDEEAQKAYVDVSKQFVEASRDFFASTPDYFADLDAVKANTAKLSLSTDAAANAAEAQLAKLTESVSVLLDIKTATLSVVQAIAGLKSAMVESDVAKAYQAGNSSAAPDIDIDRYIAANKDLSRNWEAGGSLHGMGSTLEEAARAHYNMTGRYEIAAGHRKPFAHGGIGNRPMTIGEAGIGFEAGPEGIVPLTRTSSGHLGVRSVGNERSEELLALIGQLLSKLLKQNAAISERDRALAEATTEALAALSKEVRRK